MLLPLVVLVVLCSVASATDSFTFKYSTDWSDPKNWVNLTPPKAGEIASFPESFADFGIEDCDDLSSCEKGGRVSFRPAAGQTVQKVELAAILLPTDGVLSFDGDTEISFIEKTGTPKTAAWAERESQFDFKCAANWVVTGTTANPEFVIPCYQDVAVFNESHSYMVSVPLNTFLAQLLPDGTSLVTDPTQFSGFAVSHSVSTCPAPFLGSLGTSNCFAHCFNSCPELNPNNRSAALQIIAQHQSLLPFVDDAIEATEAEIEEETEVIFVSGVATFDIPAGTTEEQSQAVLGKIETELVLSAASSFSVTCTQPIGDALNCSFAASIAAVKLSAFSDDTAEPFLFSESFLNITFGPVVKAWFNLKDRRAATPEEYLSSLADYGTLPELLATGAYGWSDLANGNDESLPFLDNDLCERFMSAISSQADIKISLAGELARVLPVPSGAFEFESDVTCGPKVAHKTRGDQQAVFEVSSMQISAFYLYFASGATYVTYADIALDRSAQLAEASALLGEDTVRVALQDALRRVFLALLKADLEEEIAELTQSLLTTTTTTTSTTTDPAAQKGSTGGLNIIPIAAAAGGGILVLVIIVIVIVMRRRRNRKDEGPSRNVVAFENPMYEAAKKKGDDNHAAGEGLYDEPAFSKPVAKENPLYDNNDEYGAAVQALQQHSGAVEMYDEPVSQDFSMGFQMNMGGDYDTPANNDTGYLDVQPDTAHPAPGPDDNYFEAS